MPSEYILTNALEALWEAIDNWPALEDAFKKTYRFNGDDVVELKPKQTELPALAIYPDPGMSKMVQNRNFQHNYKLLLILFTDTWNLEQPNQFWQELIKAAWQSKPEGGTPYVKLATGFYPDHTQLSVDMDRITLKHGKATLTTIQLTLHVRFDPQG